MPKSIYVGNLSYSTTEDGLRELFEQFGQVNSVRLVTDRMSGRPRGFGFVEMEDEGATTAIEALDGKEFDGRDIRVSEAKEREPRKRFD